MTYRGCAHTFREGWLRGIAEVNRGCGPRRKAVYWGLVVVLALLALACMGGGDESRGVPMATPTPTLEPGPAGIPSHPRDVPGLEGILTLDDGIALWRERPADEDRTGVTAEAIRLGRYTGVTGPLAALEEFQASFLEALFRRINEAGGIHGRRIELVTRDDQYDPDKTVQVTKELVEEDQVFALFHAVGGPTHAAVHQYLEEKGVPELWTLDSSVHYLEPATSRTEFPGAAPEQYWGMALVEAVYRVRPGAGIAVIYQDDAYGRSGLQGIRYAMEQANAEPVTELAYKVDQKDISPLAQQVVDSGAEAVIFFGSPDEAVSIVHALREGLGSDIIIAERPIGLMSGNEELMDGVLTSIFQRDGYAAPDSPLYRALARLAEEEAARYHPIISAQLFAEVQHLVRALELAGPDLTREGLLEALERGFDGGWTCRACLGPTLLGPEDHWAFEIYQPVRWNYQEGRWDLLGDPVSVETSQGRGLRGNLPDFPCQPETCPWREE